MGGVSMIKKRKRNSFRNKFKFNSRILDCRQIRNVDADPIKYTKIVALRIIIRR